MLICQSSADDHKSNAAIFSPFWNEIIKSLREEDYISNRWGPKPLSFPVIFILTQMIESLLSVFIV